MSKVKFPRDTALAVAGELCALLKPLCLPERLMCTGSLRRRKELVGDIELNYIPVFGEERDGLFDTRKFNLANRWLEQLLAHGVIAKRRNKRGSTMWGQWNKLAGHAASGMPVDFFQTTEDNWFNYLVCRTGGAINNTLIASAAIAKRWAWDPYSPGFTDEHGQLVRVTRERDVYDFVGLPYLEP